MVYPISSIGAHISAVPNHQVHRMTNLKTRGDVAFFGAFGYELDLNRLTDEEIKVVKEQISFYKENRKLLHQGVFYRLKSPFEGNDTAWMVVSQEKDRAIVSYYQVLNPANGGWLKLKLKGLCEEMPYKVSLWGKDGIFYGNQLMYAGIPIDRDLFSKDIGDFASLLFMIEKA